MARPQTLTAVHEIPFVGGSLCLDFVNTTGARASSAPRERLTRYLDLLVWSRRAGILDTKTARQLRRAAADRHPEAATALRRARTLRENLHQLFSSLAVGHRPASQLLARLAREWRAAQHHQELIAGAEGFQLRLVVSKEDFDQMVPPIALSAVDLLTSARLRLLRRCAECDWLFLDESKNGTRRWCKSTCGNRARSRERYARARDAHQER